MIRLVHPQREDYWGNVNPVGPRGVYDEAKRFAEALTTAYRTTHGVNTGIVRIFNTYGPRMRPFDGRAIPTFIRQALAGEPLTVSGTGAQTRSICYVSDLVAGILAMSAAAQSGPINIGNPNELSVRQIAEDVITATASSSTIEFVDRPVDDPRGAPSRHHVGRCGPRLVPGGRLGPGPYAHRRLVHPGTQSVGRFPGARPLKRREQTGDTKKPC